jgi:GDPmannose 4,6-dehydratase
MRRALITGITGQDGSYLAELLLSRDYEVWGLIRRTSTTSTQRIDHIIDRLRLVHGDMSDALSLARALDLSQPDEVYNLASQSHVLVSFEMPDYTSDVTAVGPIRLLQLIQRHHPRVRMYQASSSEMYGKVVETPQCETTPFHPRNPYAVAKACAFHAVRNFREAYGIFAVNGILFNHESPRRGEQFVTRKITRAAARIKLGAQRRLQLGNLDACRDWGFAGDYVEGMWRMLQAPEPDDYVLATGETHSVRNFVQAAFAHVGLDWREHVDFDAALVRPAEVDLLLGDASRARERLGWRPHVTFHELVAMMVEADMVLTRKELGS